MGKSKDLHKIGAPEKWFTWVSSGVTRKHYVRLERLARYEHSSLLETIKNYNNEKSHTIGPCGLYYKLFTIIIYVRNAIGQYYRTMIVNYDHS